MQAVRSEKAAMRNFWMETLEDYHQLYSDGLLYVTLPGAQGYEFELMIERDLINLTEVHGIAVESMGRVAAIEASPRAVAELQEKFPGLKIYQNTFQGLVRGNGLLSYPTGEDKDCCRARVINLDLNETLVSQDGASFPILLWIQKLGQLHAADPRIDWCLYLTLHGEVRWSANVSTNVGNFIRENFGRAEKFSAHARRILGDRLYDNIFAGVDIDMAALSREEQQNLLMTFVPKKIADLVRAQHWRLETKVNLRYGQPGHAPMVSWIIHFRHDDRAAGTPEVVYLESVNGVLAVAGHIDANGDVTKEIDEAGGPITSHC
jgi:hypothetical protein